MEEWELDGTGGRWEVVDRGGVGEKSGRGPVVARELERLL